MAKDWFGVDREEDRLQLLGVLAQRIFPTSLTAFYRAEQMARNAAHQMLQFQLPEAEPAAREQIVNELISGFGVHSRSITREEAKSLGLRVTFASSREELVLWDIARELQRGSSEEEELPVLGMIVNRRFCARKIQGLPDTVSQQMETSSAIAVHQEPRLQQRPKHRWHIERPRSALHLGDKK
jgi:hypothetical protein